MTKFTGSVELCLISLICSKYFINDCKLELENQSKMIPINGKLTVNGRYLEQPNKVVFENKSYTMRARI